MPVAELQADTKSRELANECLYRLLAAALRDPYKHSFDLLFDRSNQEAARLSALMLREEGETREIALGFGELAVDQLDVAPVFKSLGTSLANLRAEYDRVFGLVLSKECPPYETEYHPSSEDFFRAQQLADVAGFYQAFGLAPSAERADHIALELEFMAVMQMRKRLAGDRLVQDAFAGQHFAVCADAEEKFFRDHIAWWAPAFATGLRRKAQTGFYASIARLLAAFLPLERTRLGIPAPRLPLQPSLIERPEEQASCTSCQT